MDYGYVYAGVVYTPNSTRGIHPTHNAERNAALEATELERWKTAPLSGQCYLTTTTVGATVTTWLGTSLGTIMSVSHYHNALTGTQMAAVTVRATNGAVYGGRCGCEWSQLCRLRKLRQRHEESAMTSAKPRRVRRRTNEHRAWLLTLYHSPRGRRLAHHRSFPK